MSRSFSAFLCLLLCAWSSSLVPHASGYGFGPLGILNPMVRYVETREYHLGYQEGYGSGFARGFDVGKGRGLPEGIQQGLTEGYNAGWQTTYQPAFDASLAEQYVPAATQGWQSGFSLGMRSGYDAAESFLVATSIHASGLSSSHAGVQGANSSLTIIGGGYI